MQRVRSEDFVSSAPGELIQVRQDGQTYWAFVPDPLPPPHLDVDWRLARAISDASAALSELAGLGRTLPNPDLLITPFVRREAMLSSRIEGTQVDDLVDLFAFEAEQLTLPGFERSTPAVADLREVQNYVKALDHGVRRLRETPITLKLICELHDMLLRDVRGGRSSPGTFRTIQNFIGGDQGVLAAQPTELTAASYAGEVAPISQARYVPPPPARLPACLDTFEKYMHVDDEFPLLARAAFLHYKFEAIHPFVDGNGRLGRLLISLLLVHWRLLPLPWLYLSAWFEKHRQEYYHRLLEVSAAGDWTQWIIFFLQGVKEQAQDANMCLKQLLALQSDWRKRVTQARSSALLLDLVDMLFEMPICTIPQVAERLQVHYPSAKNAVERLEQSGILTRLGENNYGKVFAAVEILKILSPRV